MKLTLSKDLDALRASALARLDAAFVHRRLAIEGRNASLYAVKASEAERVIAGQASRLVADREEAEAILSKRAATLAALALTEAERQARQETIRAATTPAAIEAVLADLEETR